MLVVGPHLLPQLPRAASPLQRRDGVVSVCVSV